MASEKIRRYDASKTREVLEQTKARMGKGMYPRIALGHADRVPGITDKRPSVGRIVSLDGFDSDGVLTIVGDMEMSREQFDANLATNAYPRRSAEIFAADSRMTAVALIGAETAARDMADTDFSAGGMVEIFSAETTTFEMQSPGGGQNTYIPSTGEGTEGKEMTREEIVAIVMECLKSCGVSASAPAAATVESDAMSRTEPAKVAPVAPAAPAPDTFAREREEFTARIEQLEHANRVERFSRTIDNMAAEGFRIPAARRESLISALAVSKDPDAMVALFRDTFARDPIGQRIDGGIGVRLKGVSGPLSDEQVQAVLATNPANMAEYNARIAAAKAAS